MSNFTSPAKQALNLIRYIGDKVSQSGEPIGSLPGLKTIMDAPSEAFAEQLVKELRKRGIITIESLTSTFHGTKFSQVNLTLAGWEQYEAEKRGGLDGNYGFIAMQFDDDDLDDFVQDVVKPEVKKATGCDLVTLHDVAKAGVIDNIMRIKIRDAKFVIADLTHDNRGAYWEAGYAEGLGKPVIYICEKTKFDEKKTHFDTNHCTTIPWSRDDDAGFCERLTATLRRSLDQSS